MTGTAASGLHRRARLLENTPRTVVADVADDVDRAARRVGGHMSGLGGQLHTRARIRDQTSSAQADIVGVPAAAWGVAQKGARRHPEGAKGQRMPIGKKVRVGPFTHPGVRRRRSWSKVLTAADDAATRRWADAVAKAVR